MSKLSTYLNDRIKNKPVGTEYEEAFRSAKMFNITMSKAILGEASKQDIEDAIILMQSSLEVVKTCNGSTSDDIMKGVNEKFEIVENIEEVKETQTTKNIPKPPSSRRK